MTDREIEKIAEVFRRVMKETFGMDCQTHVEHHSFITKIRKRLEYAIRAAIWTGTTIIISGALGYIGWAIFDGPK